MNGGEADLANSVFVYDLEPGEGAEKSMEIKNPEENAVKFYANMFFYYSVYDGASDKAEVKCQFEHMLGKIVEEMKDIK